MGWDYTPWQTSLWNILWAAHSSLVDQRILVQACSLLQKMLNRMWEKVNSLQASTWAENNLKCLENIIQNTNIQITYSSSSKYDRIVCNEQHPWCFIMFFFCFVLFFMSNRLKSESGLVLVRLKYSIWTTTGWLTIEIWDIHVVQKMSDKLSDPLIYGAGLSQRHEVKFCGFVWNVPTAVGRIIIW